MKGIKPKREKNQLAIFLASNYHQPRFLRSVYVSLQFLIPSNSGIISRIVLFFIFCLLFFFRVNNHCDVMMIRKPAKKKQSTQFHTLHSTQFHLKMSNTGMEPTTGPNVVDYLSAWEALDFVSMLLNGCCSWANDLEYDINVSFLFFYSWKYFAYKPNRQ